MRRAILLLTLLLCFCSCTKEAKPERTEPVGPTSKVGKYVFVSFVDGNEIVHVRRRCRYLDGEGYFDEEGIVKEPRTSGAKYLNVEEYVFSKDGLYCPHCVSEEDFEKLTNEE